MNKKELIEQVAIRTSMGQKSSAMAVNAVIDVVSDVLEAGNEVAIQGFGIFGVRNRPQRRARNPVNGEALVVPACTVPYFKPGKTLKEAVK